MKTKIQLVILLTIVCQFILFGQQKGTVIFQNMDAPSLANSIIGEPISQPIGIYLPPSYYKEPNKKYPVVYFLPGYEDTVDVYTKGFYGGYYFESSMNSNLTQGRIKEVIMVIVNGYNILEGSFFNNSPVTGNWEDFVVNDVVNYIDANFRTLPSADSRALIGLSMGGYGALHLSMKHPTVFSIGLGECPGLASPTGMMKTSLFDNTTVIKRIIGIKKELNALSKEEAHKAYFEIIKKYKSQGDWITLFSLAYGSAFAPDVMGNAPYFHYPFTLDSNNNLVKDEIIFQQYENGFGNLKAKVEQYKGNLLQLKGYAIDYGKADYFKWITEGSIYYSTILTEAGVPNQLWENSGGHGDLHKTRTENVQLPYCDAILTFDNQNLSDATLIEKLTCLNQDGNSIIDVTEKKIYVNLKAGANLKTVKPIIYLSPGAKISPAQGMTQDFSSGTVNYTVTSENGTESSIWTVYVNNTLNVETFKKQNNKLKICPNPTTNNFILSNEDNLIHRIEIIDIFGRVILKKTISNPSETIVIERGNITSGTYFIKAFTNSSEVIEKVIFN